MIDPYYYRWGQLGVVTDVRSSTIVVAWEDGKKVMYDTGELRVVKAPKRFSSTDILDDILNELPF